MILYDRDELIATLKHCDLETKDIGIIIDELPICRIEDTPEYIALFKKYNALENKVEELRSEMSYMKFPDQMGRW